MSSVQSSEDGEDRPVRINYFAVHTCTLCETTCDVKIILFSASWFKFHPNKDSCGKTVTIYGSVTFLQHIKCQTVSLVDTFNHASVLLVHALISKLV